jgi:heme exporter protein C
MTAPPPAPERSGFDWLLAAAVLALAGTFVRVIYFTPIEARQGAAQKIFYMHVPSAFIGMYVAFGIVAVAGVLYLWLRDERLDRVAASAAEVGVVFMTVVLVTGPLWAKPIWGTWWTWDARLTLTLFLWFVFVGYLILRGAIDDPAVRGRYSAVLGVLGAMLVPFIHLSVYLFRTLHPMPILLKPSRPSLPPDMLATFILSFLSFALLFVALLRMRYRLAIALDELAEEDASESPVASLRAESVR